MRILYISLFILFTIISGCVKDGNNSDLLDRADLLLDLHPDSSLTLLNKINQKKFLTKKDKARYSLLYTMSKLKIDGDIENDTSFHDAENYYGRKDVASRETMLTHFAKAALSDSTMEKLYEFDKSIELASGEGADTYKALAYFNKAHAYHEEYSYPDEMECANKGLEIILATNDTANIIYGYMVLGMANNANGDHSEAMSNFSKALNLVNNSNYKELSAFILKETAYTNSVLGNYRNAVELYDSLAVLNDVNFSVSDICIYALALANIEQINSASSLLQSLNNESIQSNMIEWLYANAVVKYKQRDYKSAYEYMDSILLYDNMLLKAKLNASLPRKEKINAINEVTLQKEITQKNKQITWLIAIMSVMLLIILIVSILLLLQYYKRQYCVQQNKFNQLRLESDKEKQYLLGAIEHLDSENRQSKENLNAMNAQMLRLENQKNNLSQFIGELKDKIAAMDNDKDQLTNEVSFYQQSKIELSGQILVQENTINELKERAKKLFISMHGSVAAFCNNLPHEISTIDAINVYEIQRNLRLDAYKDSVFLDETEAQINDFMDNVLSMLKDSLILSEADVKTLIYDICGFNYRSIAYLLNVAPTAAGARRTRLKDKISKLDSEKQVICKKYINLL